ncbi:MAG: hypothetical protein WC823_06345 [Parcubacteria group bacterium]|jgi:hypothetical protein
MKYPKVELGTIEAVWNKLGGEEGVARFLRGELTVSEPIRKWREQDGVIYFTLPTTDGTTGEGWIGRLESKGFRIRDYTKSILRSKDFVPTNGVTTEIAVLKGMLFEDSNRTTKKIRAEADKRKFTTPNAEVACLIREMFTDKELEAMGLWWIVAMHEPIKDSVGGPVLLYADRHDDGLRLYAYFDLPDYKWYRDGGFAFVVVQKLSALD